MDLASDIIKELEYKDYDDFTKIRFIYLYLCNIFSYDSRFYNKNNPELRREIYYKEIDIRNVQDFEIICYTFSKVIKDVLALFGFESKIVIEDTESVYAHTYVEVKVKGYRLKLDPSKYYDTARVKLKFVTYGFTDLDGNNDIYYDILEADKIINGYSDKYLSYDNYHNTVIKDIERTFSRVAKMMDLDSGQIFDKKLKEIFEKVNYKFDLTRHNDINYYLSYLIGAYNLKEEDSFVRGSIFFNKDNSNDVIDIFYVKHKNHRETFYVLKKVGKYYHISEISPKTVLALLDYYEGLNDFYYQELANKLVLKKGRGVR